jgi:peptide/nickel transport system ATP-binding protein
MYAGRIVEQGTVADVLSRPRHPYTRGLLDSVPSMSARGTRLAQIPGMAPSPLDVPAGCAFRNRCGYATDLCAVMPAMGPIDDPETGRTVRCHHPLADAPPPAS